MSSPKPTCARTSSPCARGCKLGGVCAYFNEDGTPKELPVPVLAECNAIRAAMEPLGWEYQGGGPYPHTPSMTFQSQSGDKLTVTVRSETKA